jgi:hypothetical protein
VSRTEALVSVNLSPKGGIKSSPRDFYFEPLHLARALVIEMKKGDIDVEKMTECAKRSLMLLLGCKSLLGKA